MSRRSILAVVLTLSSGVLAHADTLLGSYATGTTAPAGVSNTAVVYNGSGTTYDISPNGIWAGPLANSSWVSLNSGTYPDGPVVEPSGTYVYSTTFTATAASSGTISVLADDTTSIYLNGFEIALAATGEAQHCTPTVPNCTMVSTYALPESDFVDGTNVLTFDVEQLYKNGTGLDFSGSVTGVTPEPSSFALLGTGLLGIAGIVKKRFA